MKRVVTVAIILCYSLGAVAMNQPKSAGIEVGYDSDSDSSGDLFEYETNIPETVAEELPAHIKQKIKQDLLAQIPDFKPIDQFDQCMNELLIHHEVQ